MTNQEAIEYLKIEKRCADGEPAVIELKKQMCDMAIKALEEQDKHEEKVKKCIERIEKKRHSCLEEEKFAYEQCKKIIKEEMGCGNERE